MVTLPLPVITPGGGEGEGVGRATAVTECTNRAAVAP